MEEHQRHTVNNFKRYREVWRTKETNSAYRELADRANEEHYALINTGPQMGAFFAVFYSFVQFLDKFYYSENEEDYSIPPSIMEENINYVQEQLKVLWMEHAFMFNDYAKAAALDDEDELFKIQVNILDSCTPLATVIGEVFYRFDRLIRGRNVYGFLLEEFAPTISPSVSPTTAALNTVLTALEPSASNGMDPVPLVQKATAALDIECNVQGDNSGFVTVLKEGLFGTICGRFGTGTRCGINITDHNCDPARRMLRTSSRGLSSTEFTFTFTSILDVYCQTNDCSDASEIVAAVSDTIKETFTESIASGEFIEQLQNAAADSGDSSLIAAVSAAVVSSSPTFETVVLPDVLEALIETLGSFYPDWSSGGETCLNDGNAPLYMKRGSGNIMSSLEECCDRYFSWDTNTCMMLGGATISDYASEKFYVNYMKESCEQDCQENTSGKNCGGLVPSWKTLYENAADCCEQKLFWVEESKCISDSTLTPATAPAGSGEYYKKGEKCVKDCETGSGDSSCGGLAERWDDTFTTAADCCSEKVWWVDASKWLP